MKATLVIPRPPLDAGAGHIVNSRAVYRFKLRWTEHHPASHYGLGVLLAPNNEVLDGFMFRHLRDSIGVWIKSDDPERVAGALGIGKEELLNDRRATKN